MSTAAQVLVPNEVITYSYRFSGDSSRVYREVLPLPLPLDGLPRPPHTGFAGCGLRPACELLPALQHFSTLPPQASYSGHFMAAFGQYHVRHDEDDCDSNRPPPNSASSSPVYTTAGSSPETLSSTGVNAERRPLTILPVSPIEAYPQLHRRSALRAPPSAALMAAEMLLGKRARKQKSVHFVAEGGVDRRAVKNQVHARPSEDQAEQMIECGRSWGSEASGKVQLRKQSRVCVAWVQ